MNEMKNSNGSASRYGTLSVAVTAIVIAIIIILNLIVGRLPSNILQIDISDQKLYSISDTSKDFAASLDTDVEFILLSELGSTDERITKFVNNYASMSDHISIETIDPVLYPSVLETYSTEANSLVVKNSETGKFRAIPFLGITNALITYSLDWSTYEYYENGFDADGQITSAIAYVSNETTGTIYTLTGHGESDLGESAVEIIEKSNIVLSDTPADILLDGGIAGDCDMLIINDLSTDITSDEKDIILEYLANGGHVLIISDLVDGENLNAIMSEYGMEMQPGRVGDQERYYQQYANFYGYYCISPVISGFHAITTGIEANAFLIYPRGMLISDPARDTITTRQFLKTSEQGVHYIDDTTLDTGEYIIGASAIEETDNGTASLVVVACSSMFTDEILSTMPSMSNSDIFSGIISFGFDGIDRIAIPAKSLAVETNTINSYQWWSLLYIGVIPVCVFIGGLVFWLRRRKR